MKITLQEKLLISALRENRQLKMLREAEEKKKSKFKKFAKIASMLGVPVAAVATYVLSDGAREVVNEFGKNVYDKIAGFFNTPEPLDDPTTAVPGAKHVFDKGGHRLDRAGQAMDKLNDHFNKDNLAPVKHKFFA